VGRTEILTGPERRRRWSDEEKIGIVREAAGGASVAEVARAHDITRQHIYQWRSAMRSGRLVAHEMGVAGFLPVELLALPSGGHDDDRPSPMTESRDLAVEVLVKGGRVLRVPTSLPVGTLQRLIRAVEGA
jgi:transposase